uniref:Ig-like domain-containing protein n=1 Tax=Macrostomum lignano TaxID=282301 RepID=A0A1I8JR53_9PLAT
TYAQTGRTPLDHRGDPFLASSRIVFSVFLLKTQFNEDKASLCIEPNVRANLQLQVVRQQQRMSASHSCSDDFMECSSSVPDFEKQPPPPPPAAAAAVAVEHPSAGRDEHVGSRRPSSIAAAFESGPCRYPTHAASVVQLGHWPEWEGPCWPRPIVESIALQHQQYFPRDAELNRVSALDLGESRCLLIKDANSDAGRQGTKAALQSAASAAVTSTRHPQQVGRHGTPLVGILKPTGAANIDLQTGYMQEAFKASLANILSGIYCILLCCLGLLIPAKVVYSEQSAIEFSFEAQELRHSTSTVRDRPSGFLACVYASAAAGGRRPTAAAISRRDLDRRWTAKEKSGKFDCSGGSAAKGGLYLRLAAI